jgi:hypothetical protein
MAFPFNSFVNSTHQWTKLIGPSLADRCWVRLERNERFRHFRRVLSVALPPGGRTGRPAFSNGSSLRLRRPVFAAPGRTHRAAWAVTVTEARSATARPELMQSDAARPRALRAALGAVPCWRDTRPCRAHRGSRRTATCAGRLFTIISLQTTQDPEG